MYWLLILPLAIHQAPAALSPAGACAAALADVQTIAPAERPFIRYLWSIDGDEGTWTAASWGVNYGVSLAATQVPPKSLAGGHLIRVDLRECLRDADGLPRLLALWAHLATLDPYFHVKQLGLVDVPRFQHANGRWYTRDYRPRFAPAPHLGAAGKQLEAAIGCQGAAILEARWFARMALSTLEGGMYYDFRGLTVGKTTLSGYLRSRGVDEASIARLRTGERAIMLISQVTGKPRAIDYMQGSGAQPSVASGRVFITTETKNANQAIESHPLYNVLGSRGDAFEVIVEQDRRLEYTLFDQNKKLARSVPEDIAADHEIPSPHTRQVQPGIGCIRCHGKDGGWRTFGDDLSSLLNHDFGGGPAGTKTVLGPIADLSQADQTDALLRIKAAFGGNPADVLRGARDDHASNLFMITGGQRPEAAAAALSTAYAALEYTAVTAETAAKEIGRPGSKFSDVVPGQQPEDPLIGALRAGRPIIRRDWERVFALAAERANRNQQAQN
jgi:hypothetical protein